MMYRHWKARLHPSVRLHRLELAGRGRRFEDRFYNDMSEAVEDLYSRIEPHLGENDFAFFGHSMGALLCYEVIGSIWNRRKLAPLHAFLSGRVPPNMNETKMLHLQSDAELKAEIMLWRVLTPQQLADETLLRLFLPILRADMKIVETYYLLDRDYHRLPCPISILAGANDNVAQAEKMSSWTDFTTQSCSFHTFPGGHSFIAEHTDEVIDFINATFHFFELCDPPGDD